MPNLYVPSQKYISQQFLTKCWDPLELSKGKKLLDLVYIYPRGVRSGSHLFFLRKSAFLKHPNGYITTYLQCNEYIFNEFFGFLFLPFLPLRMEKMRQMMACCAGFCFHPVQRAKHISAAEDSLQKIIQRNLTTLQTQGGFLSM